MDMCKGNSSPVKVEAGEGRGMSFLRDKGSIGRKGSVKYERLFPN